MLKCPVRAEEGRRRIKALLKRRYGITTSRKTVLRVMDELKQKRIWHKPARPKRVEKMNSDKANQAWQIDMTSFQLSYTGYNAPDDNAFVERVIRTIKEEEIWPNVYDTFSEAWDAIVEYVRYYNNERIHSSLDYQTPSEVAAEKGITLKAA